MNKEHLAILRRLRARLPIGYREGLDLLEQTGGDEAQTEALFKAAFIRETVAQHNVPEALAKKHLEATNYDRAKALERIEEEQYTFLERMLRKPDNTKRIISTAVGALIERHDLDYPEWPGIPVADFEHMPPADAAFLVLDAWLDYEDYEGFEYALFYHAERTINALRNLLQLEEAAQILEKAFLLRESVWEEWEHARKTRGSWSPSAELNALNKAFNMQKKNILAAMEGYVRENVGYFNG